jgi:hypothetical protein
MSTFSLRAENGVERPSINYTSSFRFSAGAGADQVISPPTTSINYNFGSLNNNVLNNGVNTQTLSAFVDANSPIHHLDIEGMSASATSCTDRILNSGAATWSSTQGSALAKGTYFGKDCINIDACNQISVSNSMGNLPQYYTMFAVWYPRVTDSGWRTWWRGSNDHIPMVNNGSKAFGVYSNRSGNSFYGLTPAYNITIDWQTVIVTGEGGSATDANGTSTFYVNGTSVGTVGRTKCGTTGDSFGWSGQAPGYFMEIGILGKVLSSSEITDLNNRLTSRMNGGGGGGANWYPKTSDNESYVYNSGQVQEIFTSQYRKSVPVTRTPRSELLRETRKKITTTGITGIYSGSDAAPSGGGGGGGGGSDSAVASTIKQIWY